MGTQIIYQHNIQLCPSAEVDITIVNMALAQREKSLQGSPILDVHRIHET